MKRRERFWIRAALIGFFVTCFAGYLDVYGSRYAGSPIRSDGEGYYNYLVNLFIYDDLSGHRYVSEWLQHDEQRRKAHGIAYMPEHDSYIVRYPAGVSLLVSPFFLLAHGITLWTGGAVNGFSYWYQYITGSAAVFYTTLGLMFTILWLRRHFSLEVSLATAFLTLYGTNLFHYATYDSMFSHAFSFFAVAGFLYGFERWLTSQRLWFAVLSGAFVGLIAIIRVANAVIPLLVILFYAPLLGLRQHWGLLAAKWPHLLLMVLSSIVVFSPQCVYWYLISGQPIILNTYLDEASPILFRFLEPRWDMVLYQPTKGVFFWTPLLALSFVGLVVSGKKGGPLLLPTGLAFVVTAYLYACWLFPGLGGGYGHRGFVEFFALSAFGLACLLKTVRSLPQVRPFVYALIALFVMVNVQRTYHYWNGTIGFGRVTMAHYIDTLFVLKKRQPF